MELFLGLLTVTLAAFAPSAAIAQNDAPQSSLTAISAAGRPEPQRRDSADARRRATRAQIHFEQIRRLHLPLQHSSPPTVCDAMIGRFCQWNDDVTSRPEESRRITNARRDLLANLEGAATRSPNDGWITGQRIRYLIEAGDDSTAVDVALACVATEWWCDALRGLALHEAESAGADSAFDRALAVMPEKERCRWTDISALLDGAQRKKYRRVGCGAREEIAARIWWLADPFLTVPGNDRRTEHYARHTMSRILDGTRAGYDTWWDDDLRELVVRYGWSRYWTRPPGNDPSSRSVSGHEASPSYHFLPAVTSVDSIFALKGEVWDLRMQRAVERYRPTRVDQFRELDAQVALFRRRDSVMVVAAYDVSADTAFAPGAVTSMAVLQRDETDQKLFPLGQLRTARGAHVEMMSAASHLLSVETFNFEKRRAGRTRRVVSLPVIAPGSVSISDVLLFDPPPGEVRDLAHALPHALGSLTVPAGKKLGLYWEMYGLARADSAFPVSLTLRRVSRGSLRRLAETMGLAERSSPLTIAWRETEFNSLVAVRSVVLDLALIPRGRYVLRVEVKPAAGAPVGTSRAIEIR